MNLIMQQIQAEILLILQHLHFVRADWFYAFIPLLLYLLLSLKKTGSSKNWQSVVDASLFPFVLSQKSNRQSRYPLLLVFIAASLCITALAGPVYKKLPQPVYREQSSLVVLLDLSQSMNATDVKPSRLERAKLELLDILKTRKTGQTALVVYAADAFVVTPLTDDNATIANLVPSLETDMMPAQGSNLSTALTEAAALFSQAGIINGNILAITDDIHERDEAAIIRTFSLGHRISIFGIGSAQGAPVPVNGGFLQDNNGAIVVPRLYADKLQRYALAGGGLYTGMRAGDSDVNKLTRLFESSEVEQNIDNKELNADVWQEEGYWLLLPLLFFAALWARKGWLAVLLVVILPVPQPAYAEINNATSGDTQSVNIKQPVFDTRNLWSSQDQKAMQAFNAGDNEKAASLFTLAEWKASAYYRKGDYAAAAKTLENTATSDGHYNRGNALAKLGNFDEAIRAYDKAIELDENNADAKYNREQVKQAQQKQQQKNNSEQDSSEKNDSEQQNSEQQKNSEQKKSEQQNSQQQEQQDNKSDGNDAEQDRQQSSEDQSQDQQTGEQNQEENNEAENQQLKQRDAEAEKEQQQEEQNQYEQQQNEEKDKQNNSEQTGDIENKEVENEKSDEKPLEIEVNPVEASISEEEKATEQWLKRIPDDPGGLLRRKFLYQYQQIPNQNDDDEPW